MKYFITLLICIIFNFFLFSSPVLAVELELQQKLTSPEAGSGGMLKKCFDISGEYAIISAPSYQSSKGAVYIFHREGMKWSLQQRLQASDAIAHAAFGWSVSISGNYAIVGAYNDYEEGQDLGGRGAAYIFHREGSTWTQQQKLIASDAEKLDWFGYSVNISGDYAIVGAYGEDGGGSNSGAAYIFLRDGTTWTQQQKLMASDATASRKFGMFVGISGNNAIVADSRNSEPSAYYFFYRSGSTWIQQQKLESPAQTISYHNPVSISGNYAILGFRGYDDGVLNSGCAYIIHRDGSTWKVQQTLKPSEPLRYLTFGYSVKISGAYAIVGTHWAYNQDPQLNSENGTKDAAYVFYRDGSAWTLQQKLTPPDSEASDYFAHSVSISAAGKEEVYALVGALGSAYIFSPVVDPGNDDSDDEDPDSLPDSETIHTKKGNKDVTLGLATSNTKLKNVKAVSRDSSDIPSSLETPYGLFSFTITELACEGATAKMVLYVDYDASIIGYYKKNVRTGEWENISTSIEKVTVDNEPKTKVTFYLTDGGDYDEDGEQNGSIDDDGALVTSSSVPVATNMQYCLMIFLLACLGSILLRKKRF